MWGEKWARPGCGQAPSSPPASLKVSHLDEAKPKLPEQFRGNKQNKPTTKKKQPPQSLEDLQTFPLVKVFLLLYVPAFHIPVAPWKTSDLCSSSLAPVHYKGIYWWVTLQCC